MRLIDADALYKSFGASGNCNNCPLDAYKCQYYNEHTLMEFCERIDDAPTVDAVEVVRCKDCIHKPTGSGINHDITFPEQDYRCPCRCEDYWYSWMPDDDWFCANGERREDGETN